jgi:putative membrane protein insertion efficiency factor
MLTRARFAKVIAQAPIYLYRWTLKPWIGRDCRYLPTCSEYALEAIESNGAWKGLWQTLARLCRCQPWGSSGYDPVPDLSAERHLLRPWRYGHWRGTNQRPRPPAPSVHRS